jgi:hypothetical protein
MVARRTGQREAAVGLGRCRLRKGSGGRGVLQHQRGSTDGGACEERAWAHMSAPKISGEAFGAAASPRAVNGSDLLFLVVEITQLAHNLFYLLLRCIISFIYVCMRLIFKNMITFIVIIKFT